MGVKNRERRRQKQAKQNRNKKANSGRTDGGGQQGRGRSSGQSAWSPPGSDEEVIDSVILLAAHADCSGRIFDHEELVARLVRGEERVASRISSLLVTALGIRLQHGWEPHEIIRILRRRQSAQAARIVAAPLVDAARHCTRESQVSWESQIAEVAVTQRRLDPTDPRWPDDVEAGVRALGALQHLPAMPDLGKNRPAATRRASSTEEERLLVRVRGLLAKAESSDFPEEADALMGKAQELMTRHCLDRALLESDDAAAESGQLDSRRCWLEDPYVDAKAILLSVVAQANRCRAVMSSELGFSTLVGHPDDLDATELLFTSLLVQATRRITALAHDPVHANRSRRPSYRRSFLIAYAYRIGDRLDEANSAITKAAGEGEGGRLLPVLARRSGAVDEAIDTMFSELVPHQASATNHAGFAAGTAAAEMANLGVNEQLPFVVDS
jgi:hypothetical protein